MTLEPSDLSKILPSETKIAGPHVLYNRSFIIEYLEPEPIRNSSVLMHVRYVADNPETNLGKKYAQSPPLHLHFEQAESFVVLEGRIGTTTGWQCRDQVWTAKDGTQTIHPLTVHSFWPVTLDEHPDTAGEAKVDCRMLVWAHPRLEESVYPPSMDHLFFQSLLGFASDVHEGKEKLDVALLMLMQHESRTAMVMLPSWWVFGPIRWWLPWTLQGLLAAVARWQGKLPVLEKYVGKEDFDMWLQSQRKLKAR